jgi:hypothetical protein
MIRYKARKKPKREAYIIYVERLGLKRNAVDERFSTTPLPFPDLFLISAQIRPLNVLVFQ